jgi:hypothetical protein
VPAAVSPAGIALLSTSVALAAALALPLVAT